MRYSSIIALPLSLCATFAAAEATPEGAAALTATFQNYLGTTEGVVAVAVDGDTYEVTIDPAPLVAKIPAQGLTASVTPLVLTLTDNEDGTWDYALDQPVSLAYAMPGMMSTKTEYGSVQLSGTFDEALGDSSEYHFEASDMTSEQTQTDPTLGEIAIKVSQDSLTLDGTAVAATMGVDGQITTSASNTQYAMTMPMGEGAAPMNVTATMAAASGTAKLKGYKPAALYGLLAWFVAHPDAALIEADKAGLKTQLQSALPFFENLNATMAYTDISVNSPVGEFGLDEAGVVIDMNGAVTDGKFREAFTLTGLTMPEGLLPPFAAPLVPSDLSFDFAVSKFDLASAARLALGLLDLPAGTPPGPEFEAQMLAALLPDGVVDISVAPGGATAPAYTLGFEGAMTVGPASPLPVGKATVTLKGLDAIKEALKASPPEMGMQEMEPMLGMAEAMAKPGADGALVWELEATATGAMLVNGTNMMGAE
ncbi:hypothetical protein GCM10010873_05380 [Cypionkella aquatica]|uniref:DUF2125 domain-containing protein n=1 Tax=Cypionkella aquatica TaxID=1756042 RepID=A0AA37X0B5_9RHOB|nr:hypothetical protein [Cypionkella aquatica]GLS85565.1 hypothetical protein GCM10010873_05380 [Cypionkella aquatica]